MNMLVFFITLILPAFVTALNRYSADINDPNGLQYRAAFRMSKVNLVWEKAHKVSYTVS